MSENKKNDKSDITRIEDLSEYIHEEEEFEAGGDYAGLDDDDLMDAKTDPNIEFPEEFRVGPEEDATPPDFSFLEEQEDIPQEESHQDETEEFNDTSFDDGQSFSEPEEDGFGQEQDFGGESAFGEDNSFAGEGSFDDGDFDDGDFDDGDFEQADGQDEESFSDNDDFQGNFQEDFQGELQAEQDDPEETAHFDEGPPEETPLEEPTPEMEPEVSAPTPPAEEPAPAAEKTPLPSLKNQAEYTAPENFKDLQKFAKNITYGNLATEGNPPFSIILKDIKYEEDVEDILILLKEFQVIDGQDQEDSARKSLERGSMLIPRLGEYAALTICHKLRRFDISILMGLTEEINPPKNYESDDSGLVSKYTIYNSRSHHFNLEKDEASPEDILIATTPYLEGHDIIDYVGIASENAIIGSHLLEKSFKLEDELISRLPDYMQPKQRSAQIEHENFLAAQSSPVDNILNPAQNGPDKGQKRVTLQDIHEDLLGKLKAQAIAQKGNAVIGINFHVAPIAGAENQQAARYQVTCSGSVVWVNKR